MSNWDVRKHPSYDHEIEAKTRALFMEAMKDPTFIPWNLATNILGSGLPKGEMVVLGGPSKRKFTSTIHRTHAEGPPTITTMERYGEEVTQPGVAPAEPAPEIFTKDDGSVRAAEVPCPRIVSGAIQKGQKCYLCSRQLDCYFERTPGDLAEICSQCVWTHLRYESTDASGGLRRRAEEKSFK